MKIISLVSIFVLVVLCESLPVEEIAHEPVPELAFNAEADTRFLLFTRLNPVIGQQLGFRDLPSLSNSNYNANLPTRVVIHGFQSDPSSDVNILLTAAYLRHSDANVIVGMTKKLKSLKCEIMKHRNLVDWSAGAGTINYIAARNRVFQVGPLLSRFLDFLHENNALDFSRLIVAGHSLGGKRIQNSCDNL